MDAKPVLGFVWIANIRVVFANNTNCFQVIAEFLRPELAKDQPEYFVNAMKIVQQRNALKKIQKAKSPFCPELAKDQFARRSFLLYSKP
jgi:hypothetical protein